VATAWPHVAVVVYIAIEDLGADGAAQSTSQVDRIDADGPWSKLYPSLDANGPEQIVYVAVLDQPMKDALTPLNYGNYLSGTKVKKNINLI
jgi:hypothetical protein